VKRSAIILLESAPPGVKAEDVEHDIMQVSHIHPAAEDAARETGINH
jgi:hypothetical protein